MNYIVSNYSSSMKEEVTNLILTNDLTCNDSFPPLGQVILFNSLVIGYIAGHICYNSCASIDIFVVDKAYRNLGIGKKLLLSFLNVLFTLNVSKVSAYVNIDNISAIEMYKKMGVGVSKQVYLMEEDIHKFTVSN